jgi:Putative Ig domain
MRPRHFTGQPRIAGVVGGAALAILVSSAFQPASSMQAPQQSKKLTVTTKTLPNATVGVGYYFVATASGGERPYDFSATGLPEGLAFHPASDTIGGKAATAGTYSVVITARDSTLPKPQTASVTLKLTVLPAKK